MKIKILENKQKKDLKKFLLQIFVVSTVALIAGASFKNFFVGSDFQGTGVIIPTGFSGLAEIIRNGLLLIGVNLPAAVVYLSLNVILFAFAFKIMGWRFLLLSGIGMAAYTLGMQFIAIPELIQAVAGDKLLSCVVGATLSGLCVGVAIKFGGSTGGSDIAGVIINRYFPKVKTGYCLLIINGVVLTLSVLVGGLQTGLYALIVSVVCAFATNFVLDSSKRVVAFYIICDKDEEIANAILQRFSRGVTRLEAVGMFSKKGKSMLLSLVPHESAGDMRKLVNSIDENAFVFSAPVSEMVGDGNFMKEISVIKNKIRKSKSLLKTFSKFQHCLKIKKLKLKKKSKVFKLSKKKEV